MGNTRSYGVLCSVKLQIDRLRSIVERRVRYDEGTYLAATTSGGNDAVKDAHKASSLSDVESSDDASVISGGEDDEQAYVDPVDARYRRAIGVLSAMTVLPPQRAPVKLFCGNARKLYTPYGRGKVVCQRSDGFVGIALDKWTLANKKPAIAYVRRILDTPYGRGEVLKRRDDGILVIEVKDKSKEHLNETRTVYWDPSSSRVEVGRACFEGTGDIEDARRDLVEAGLLQRPVDSRYIGSMHQRMQR